MPHDTDDSETLAFDRGSGTPPGPSTVLPVSLLVSSARLLLERHLGLVWVSGEISNFTRAASGHCYFNLKDRLAQVRCVFFKSKAQFVPFALKDGLSVEVRAIASIFEARGEFQLNVETLRLAGVGALYEKFERLKARLTAAGWFDAERKRPLPRYPWRIGLVTSRRAAALRDILATLRRRWPAASLVLYPTIVQGDGASAAIALALRRASERSEVDVLIVARGGGSIEDLWAFNEEAVARAVFECTIPIVSGVGHETDFTICDFVADLRAATPTGAAMLVTPDRAAVLADLAAMAVRWCRGSRRSLEIRLQRVDNLSCRLVHPAAKLAQERRQIATLAGRLARAYRHRLARASNALEACAGRYTRQVQQPFPQSARVAALATALPRAAARRLERSFSRVCALEQNLAHLNPTEVLQRGYAIVTTADGDIVQEAARLNVGDAIELAFARGTASAAVTRKG